MFPHIHFSPVREFLADFVNGTFEVLSLQPPSVAVDRRQL